VLFASEGAQSQVLLAISAFTKKTQRTPPAEIRLSQARAIPTMDEITAMWKNGLRETAAGWLSQHTWRVETLDEQALATKYGRQSPNGSNDGFLTATRL
jgi:hypothetical protein